MVSTELGLQLHDRATRGQVLTAEEQVQLDRWYQQQDAAEAELLEVSQPRLLNLELQQVDQAVSHLASVVQQIQQTTAENRAIKQEIILLQQQLLATQST